MRHAAAVGTVFLLGLTAAWTLSAGCSWDYVTDLPGDLGDSGKKDADSSPTDALDTGPLVLPDGRVCLGHDEDGDGVPDECDNCPNVFNPSQSGGVVGDMCAPGSAFITSPARLLFDPFTSLSSWTMVGTGVGVFELNGDKDSLVGGNAAIAGPKPDPDFRYLVGATGAGPRGTVATAVFVVRDEYNGIDGAGNAGLLVRIGADKRFFICGINTVSGFVAARAPDTGCSGGPCSPLAFAMTMPDGGSGAAQRSFPAELPHSVGVPIGVRISITASPTGDAGTGGEIECRVFDPTKPTTLNTTDTSYFVRTTIVPSRWIPSGEVGIYASASRVEVRSIDVLRSP